ncbi:MAG: cytochrome c-type biogenesis protein CcmH [Gammaproteobacteria bacterium]|nr:MAG: cytochrome c-type biogenesis protein CcmH [Gammaproteobacteria bacterium]
MKRIILFLMVLLFSSTASSVTVEVYEFTDKQHESLYKKMITELRCLVCQNQNLADSNAELAVDLRAKTYKLVTEDKTEQEIINWMTEKYGDFVLYKPQLNSKTYLLWGGPFLLGFLSIIGLIIFVKKQKTTVEIEPEDLKKAQELLK